MKIISGSVLQKSTGSRRIMKKLVSAYRDIILTLAYFIAGSVFISAAGFMIVAPLWIAAVRFRLAFTYLFFAALMSFLVWIIISSARKDRDFPSRLLGYLLRFFLFIAASVLIFCSLILFRYGYFLYATVIIIVLFLFAGFFRMFYSRQNNY